MAIAAAMALGGCSSGQPDATATPVPAGNVALTAAQRQHIHLYTVTPTSYRDTIETTGAVDFDNDHATSVLAPFNGPVTRVLVSLGQKVARGQPLAIVSSGDFSSAVSTYSKAIITARNARTLANADKDLLAHDGIAQREAAQAQIDTVGAEADRDAARAALVALNVGQGTISAIQAGHQISGSAGVIRSPIAGTVVEKLVTPGQLLQAGTTPCFTVANLSRVWVQAQISGSDVAAVRAHDPAEIESGTGAGNLHGTVDYVSALVDPDTRSVSARIVVDNPSGVLKKQMYVGVRIESGQQKTGLLVPVSAILHDDENLPFVYLARPDGSFARQHVALGDRTGDQYNVTDGVQPGNRIVIDGAIYLQFMQSQ
ncbi:MAG: efflux RND transporter periplasmic adaptor subunit [Pseudomonadota bacterium]|nr:efflux RND transporter periplasmic adaptor subunit [Pseudomonadota bacterium]